jgi:adenine-specific DNA-methyltransferase
MDKLNLHTPDFTEGNIAKIAELFPSCIVEARDDNGALTRKVDFDQLRQELSDSIVEGPQERYRLDWPGKRESLLTANAPIAKTLRPCREESVDFDKTQNLFIEGDNLDALKLLQETYLGKVKLIYIDPPYNTGNDFIYDDDFAEDSSSYFVRSNQIDETGGKLIANTESNGRFHSDWMTMLFTRLKLARNLLTDEGVIFVSIDDHEVHNARKILDEVFGESNFLGQMPVVNNMKGRNDQDFHAQTHEYLLAYQKVRFLSLGLPLSDEKKSEYKETTEDGRHFQWRDLRKRGGADTRRERPNLYYSIYINPDTGEASLTQTDTHTQCALPLKSDGEDGRWRWEKNTLKQRIHLVKGRYVPAKKGWNVSYRVFLEDDESGLRREKPKSIWLGAEFSSDSGTKALNSLITGINAKELTPKPIGLLKRIAALSLSEDDIALDFFAGTSSTAHSIMQLNAEEGGNRKFIMVQLQEQCEEKTKAYELGYKNIADISKERIRRAGKKIKDENATTASDLDIGFRVLKIDSSNAKDIYYTPDAINQEELALQVDHIKEDRTAEDLLFQVMLDWGVDLALPISKESIQGKDVYFVDENAIAACFDTQINEAFVKELAKREPLRVVFRDTCFESDSAKINVAEIFKLLSPNTDIKTI